MKVVINKCFGGFGLSPLAVKRMAELSGKPCFFFKTEFKDHKSFHVPTTLERAAEGLFFSAYTVPNPDEYMASNKEWHEMTDEERVEHNKKWDEISLSSRVENRTDELLIKVVEELGEKANGSCASLSIVEIPDGVEWEINEYDGNEHIAEKHRTWG